MQKSFRLAIRSLMVWMFLVGTPSRSRADPPPKTDVVAPVQLDPVPVPYPAGEQVDASVVLELEIEQDGRVGSVAVREGHAPFDDAARNAARDWRFSPATRNGLPIRARVLAKVAFRVPPVEAPEAMRQPEAPPSAPLPVEEPPPVEVSVVGEGREELGSTHIPRNETRLIPGAFADPFRVVEILPGVAPIVSGLPYFTVRWAPPGDVGYFIDGIRVPLLFHVGAGPSVIAPALVDRVDLFPSVYPARFGRYSGGIMAGETTEPSTVGRAEAQARVFDAGAMVEQPFADQRGSVLLGGRYGYTGALLSLVAPDYSLGYWDYQARLAYRVADHDRVSAFAFGAYDFLRNEALGRTLFNVEFHRVDLRWDHETEAGKVRVAATLASDFTLNAAENAQDPGSGTSSRGVRLRIEADQRVARGLRLRAGADVGFDHFTEDREVLGGGNLVPFGRHTDSVGGAWLDLVARPAAGVEIVPALRLDVFHVRGESSVAPEPRLATRLRVAEGVAWISAFGETHQVPTFLVPVPGMNVSRGEASPQDAWQASQAIEVSLPSRIMAKVTAFRNVAFVADVQGRAHDDGIELFVRRDFTERLGGFVSYTISRADRSVPGRDSLSTFDRPQVLSVVLGYDLGGGYRVGGRWLFESGHPFDIQCPTPDCSGLLSPPSQSYLYTGRFPTFSRWDVRFEKKWKFGSGAWLSATFEWFNALLSGEVDNVAWTPAGLRFTARSPLTLPSIGIEAGY